MFEVLKKNISSFQNARLDEDAMKNALKSAETEQADVAMEEVAEESL